eukprot:2665347-Rhodomonas_salina.1
MLMISASDTERVRRLGRGGEGEEGAVGCLCRGVVACSNRTRGMEEWKPVEMRQSASCVNVGGQGQRGDKR